MTDPFEFALPTDYPLPEVNEAAITAWRGSVADISPITTVENATNQLRDNNGRLYNLINRGTFDNLIREDEVSVLSPQQDLAAQIGADAVVIFHELLRTEAAKEAGLDIDEYCLPVLTFNDSANETDEAYDAGVVGSLQANWNEGDITGQNIPMTQLELLMQKNKPAFMTAVQFALSKNNATADTLTQKQYAVVFGVIQLTHELLRIQGEADQFSSAFSIDADSSEEE